jgi:hypothetical protein
MESKGKLFKIKKIKETLIEHVFTILFNTPKPPMGGFSADDLNPPLGGQGGENNEEKINFKSFRMVSYAA